MEEGPTEGYVYCMTNEAMPGLVKIGMTCDEPETRAKELSSATGVPFPFRIYICKKVWNPRLKEQALHELLAVLGFRVNEKREFFNCALGIVDLLFAVIDGTDVQVQDISTAPAVAKKYAVNVVKLEE
jgi:T5orf172 domain